MKKARLSALWTVLVPLTLALTVAVPPLSAQDVEACRCIDRDGNEIENCSCFRAPDVSRIVRSMAPFSEVRPRLGVSIDVGQSARLDARGARVTDVMEDGPAAAAGIEAGDVITSVDGHSLLDPISAGAEDDFDLDVSVPVQRLLALSRELEPGQEVTVEYLRDDDARTAVVTADDLSSWGSGVVWQSAPGGDFEFFGDRMSDLGDRLQSFEYRMDDDTHERMQELQHRMQERIVDVAPRDFSAPGRVRVFGDPESTITLRSDGGNFTTLRFGPIGGLELMNMKAGLESYFGTSEGVLVTEIDEDSTLGLDSGDVILKIGDRVISDVAQARRILRSYGEEEDITLTIMRRGNEMNVSGRLNN